MVAGSPGGRRRDDGPRGAVPVLDQRLEDPLPALLVADDPHVRRRERRRPEEHVAHRAGLGVVGDGPAMAVPGLDEGAVLVVAVPVLSDAPGLALPCPQPLSPVAL